MSRCDVNVIVVFASPGRTEHGLNFDRHDAMLPSGELDCQRHIGTRALTQRRSSFVIRTCGVNPS